MSNLQGKIVKFHVFDENDGLDVEKGFNNHQDTCPALVVTDWSPNTDNMSDKTLNLKVFYDGDGIDLKSSVMHIQAAGFYPTDETKEGEEPVKPIKVKANYWELY